MRTFVSLVLAGWLSWGQAASAQAGPMQAAGREPGAAQVVRMAVAAARESDPKRIRALARRARLSGLVPSLRVSADRGLKQDLQSSSTDDSERVASALADDLTLQATLTFDLPRLVFASDEVRLLSVERWLTGDLRKLVEQVVHLYFERRRLVRELASSAVADPELELSIAETEALLDALTEGRYSAALRGEPHDE